MELVGAARKCPDCGGRGVIDEKNAKDPKHAGVHICPKCKGGGSIRGKP